MVHHQSPHLAAKLFFSGYAKLDQALEYVEALLPEQEVIQGVRRVTLRMFSHMALRELMANMLIHQVFFYYRYRIYDLYFRLAVSNLLIQEVLL